MAANWRNPRDRREELDLVMLDRGILVFVEVKARAAGALVPGYYAVDRRKRRVLRRAVQAYVAALRDKPHAVRFDVVEVKDGLDLAVNVQNDSREGGAGVNRGRPSAYHVTSEVGAHSV